MRTLSDKAKISREKLTYICDSTSAPVAIFSSYKLVSLFLWISSWYWINSNTILYISSIC